MLQLVAMTRAAGVWFGQRLVGQLPAAHRPPPVILLGGPALHLRPRKGYAALAYARHEHVVAAVPGGHEAPPRANGGTKRGDEPLRHKVKHIVRAIVALPKRALALVRYDELDRLRPAPPLCHGLQQPHVVSSDDEEVVAGQRGRRCNRRGSARGCHMGRI
eukprot:4860261-Prymnesium_polylepis.1